MSTTAESNPPTSASRPSTRSSKASNKKITSCGPKARPPPLDPKSIPMEVRLNYHRASYIDRLKTATPKPKGYLPPVYLPSWPYIPIDSKLPAIKLPAKMYVTARGRLGERLYHDPKYYTVYDPYHHERVLQEEYNALHDPYVKNYFKKPSVRYHLMKQGLITTDSHVPCTLKEFNSYRKYLSTHFKDDVIVKLKEQYLRELELHKRDVELKQYFERTDGANYHKIQNAKIRQRQIHEARVQRFEERQRTAEAREERIKQEQLEKRFTKQMLAYELEEARRLRLAEFRRREHERQLQIYTLQVCRENDIVQRLKQKKEAKEAEQRQQLLEWLDKRYKFQKEHLEQELLIKETIQSDFIARAEHRQRNVEHYRSILPQIVEKQKKEKERIWNLVRKYFYRWLNKVRERKARLPDEAHQSLWDITANFDDTVKYLHKESGYEKLDDLIMGILKMKQQIKEELAREAAAEEALEDEEDEEGDDHEKDAEELLIYARKSGFKPLPSIAKTND